MKLKITLLMTMLSCIAFSQQIPSETVGGEGVLQQNTEPCITEEQHRHIFDEIDQNIILLKQQGRYIESREQMNHPLFIWPVRQEGDLEYHNIWALTNYVDHNPSFPNQIQDFNCGTRSYDTTGGYNHTGYDITTWPFWWKQMELDQSVTIAAEGGQIIAKWDGNFDKNCAFNSEPFNGIAIEHSDGSRAFYLHFKNGSVTTKTVGDTVETGEFLGVIGSSGSSTGPHLHFEVFDSNNNLIDPSVGQCNSLNNDTWWADPISYYNPGINAVLTHTQFPEFNTCPETEITFESDQFEVGESVRTAVYLRDQRLGTNLDLRVVRPDNSVFAAWEFDLVDNFNISWWAWTIEPDMEGTWIWEASYMGETVAHNFSVGVLGVDDEVFDEVLLHPNPTTDGIVNLSFTQAFEDVSIQVTDILGQTIINQRFFNQSAIELEIPGSSGLYFVTVYLEDGATNTFKVIKS